MTVRGGAFTGAPLRRLIDRSGNEFTDKVKERCRLPRLYLVWSYLGLLTEFSLSPRDAEKVPVAVVLSNGKLARE